MTGTATAEYIVLGVGLVLLGGLLQGSFALPMKRMAAWRWENTWLIYSIFAMMVFPWLMAAASVPHLGDVLHQARGSTIAVIALFGFGWGVGATLFGLCIKRVGMALTFAIVLGITSSLGSLLPLLILQPQQLFTRRGGILLAGLAVVIVGIGLCAFAGRRREQEISPRALQLSGGSFWVGLLMCIFAGIFSAMLNFGFVFGKDLQQIALSVGASTAMASNAVWAVALSAGFLANAGYCIYLLRGNRSWSVFAQKNTSAGYWVGGAAMGALWFFGIMAYGIGAVDLGPLGAVVGWPLFLAMNIIAGSVWGAITGEWRGARRATLGYSWAGIAILVLAIYVISHAGVA